MSSLPSYPSANLVGQSREGHGWNKSRHFMRNKGIPCGRVIGRYRLFLWDLCSGEKGWIGLFFYGNTDEQLTRYSREGNGVDRWGAIGTT
ncbi:hypothetical protein AC624_19685 [Bacillus sp. FJAT-27238]|nr:hypothetical protein AC624_19685 [Bacillus sp. FJAT-27238]